MTCVEVWCSRCSRFFPMHLLYPRIGPGPKEHIGDCIGCTRPPVLFAKTDVELQPYDMPVTSLLFDVMEKKP